MPFEFTKDQAKVFATLSDDEGIANCELSERLKIKSDHMSREVLKPMVKGGLIYRDLPRNSPKGEYPRYPFRIQKNNAVYSSFLNYVVQKNLKEDLAKFLGSNHMNKIVGEKGFIFACEMVKNNLHDPEM